MSRAALWTDTSPATRCDWIDQLRGWALIVMIEVHCVNVWLPRDLVPGWLNYLNGLVAPSFLMCAGFSLVLSTFQSDGSLRPFKDSAGRLGMILLCAYALHAPGFTLAEWTVLSTPEKLRELFKIDVLQCIVVSLLVLQGLARLLRRPWTFALVALGLAVAIALVSPYLWIAGVADGLWLPLRGLFNGNPDRGLQALFPLFPWLAFPAFGAFLGGVYRAMRIEKGPGGQARWSELQWLTVLALLGLALSLVGGRTERAWVWGGEWTSPHGVPLLNGNWPQADLARIHNTTLPSIAARLGWISMAGALLGILERLRPRWSGPNLVASASRESLLVYMFHLFLIFSLLLAPPMVALTGWGWHTLGWPGTLAMTAAVTALSLGAALAWQWAGTREGLKSRLLRAGGAAMAIWFLLGGWWTFRFLVISPELAQEPYAFLNAARIRKGLPATPDGLSRDPEEYFSEAARRKLRLTAAQRDAARTAILARSERARATAAP